jgi:hypothetical protein
MSAGCARPKGLEARPTTATRQQLQLGKAEQLSPICHVCIYRSVAYYGALYRALPFVNGSFGNKGEMRKKFLYVST